MQFRISSGSIRLLINPLRQVPLILMSKPEICCCADLRWVESGPCFNRSMNPGIEIGLAEQSDLIFRYRCSNDTADITAKLKTHSTYQKTAGSYCSIGFCGRRGPGLALHKFYRGLPSKSGRRSRHSVLKRAARKRIFYYRTIYPV